MPSIHVSSEINKKIEDLLVKLVTDGQIKIKRSVVIELAFEKGFDNVSIQDVKERLLPNK